MYTYWQHEKSGDVYAVQTDDRGGDVVGVTGPIPRDEATSENYGAFDYDSEDAAWANGESFRLYEPQR